MNAKDTSLQLRSAMIVSLLLAVMTGCAGSKSGSPVCGNSWLDDGEECDTVDLAGQTCASRGFSGGTLACAADCTFDTTSCLQGNCGDGVIGGTELCDGAALGGQNCRLLGFSGGTLACSAGCTYDTAGCTSSGCGNGIIEAPEVCDGSELDGQTCASQGFDGGTLACALACDAFDTSGCHACGDGAINGTELCDGAEVGGQTCTSLGFSGGTLACAISCGSYDTAGCTTCGNNAREGSEICDGADLGGQTCTSQGFSGGTLACAGNCGALDTSGCSNCAGTILRANWNGYDYWKVPVAGAMSDANVAAACTGCGMSAPCSGPSGCQYNDGLCLQTQNETSCGNPMLDLSSILCGSAPSSCAALYGIYQYMGYTWLSGSACGAENGEWCASGNDYSGRFALCVIAAY